MTEAAGIEETVANYLARYNFGEPPPPDQNIFLLGTVTSLIAMQILLFIERKWDIKVPNEELQRKNFESVCAIAALVRKCRAAVG